jgi:hypothetical protein
MRSLICVVCAIVLVSSSWASATPSIGDEGRSSTTKAPGEVLVAQAWWDAAYSAASVQRQTPTQQGCLWFAAKAGATVFPRRHIVGLGARDLRLGPVRAVCRYRDAGVGVVVIWGLAPPSLLNGLASNRRRASGHSGCKVLPHRRLGCLKFNPID